ncbi:MAG: SPFH domain-containing protein [Phycisphaerae bacterium]
MIGQGRGKNVAIGGALLQLLLMIGTFLIWYLTGSLAAMGAFWVLIAGVLIWVFTMLLFYVRQLAERERVEHEEIARRGTTQTIFEGEGDEESRPAASRARVVEKWLVPSFTLLLVVYNVGMGLFMLLLYLRGKEPSLGTEFLTGSMIFVVLFAVGAFLFSRYAVGMAKAQQWRPLRAPGSFLALCALIFAAMFAALIAAYSGKYYMVDYVIAHVIPAVQIILAVEYLLNFVLDLYRPRVPGEEERLSFDSRLCNLIADPGRIGHSIAETLNYQFGFEVSKTWFYRLLAKAAFPLVAFGLLVLFLLSSVVIVDEGEQYVLFRWGDIQREPLQPGLHLKWPWPIETVEAYQTERVREVLMGLDEHTSHRKAFVKAGRERELMLWTEEHGHRAEQSFIIAVPPEQRAGMGRQGAASEGPPPVMLIKIGVSMTYVVEDPLKFGYTYRRPEKLIECIGHQELTKYVATATMFSDPTEDDESDVRSLLTDGKHEAAKQLWTRIVDRLNKLDLGVRVTNLSIVNAHPPAEAANAFQEVLAAERGIEEKIYTAQAEANRILSRIAGDPNQALELAQAIRALQDLEGLKTIRAGDEDFDEQLENMISSARTGRQQVLEQTVNERGLSMPQLSEGRLEEIRQQLATEETGTAELYRAWRDALSNLQRLQATDDKRQVLDELVAEARTRADRLFDQALGLPAGEIAKARAARWKKELAERARSEAFRREVLASRYTPRLYRLNKYLDVWDEILPSMRKYILATEKPEEIEIRLNLQEKSGLTAGTTFRPEGTRD